MHFGDSIFIFVMALVLFGPKKLPEIGRQVGKLLAEFRRASNEFKFQIQEEIRNMEEEERRNKLAESQAAKAAATPAEPATTATAPAILPPSTGAPVSAARPFASPVEASETLPVSPDLALNSAQIVPEPQHSTGNDAATELSHVAAASEAAAASLPVEVSAHSNGSHPLTGEIPESVHHD